MSAMMIFVVLFNGADKQELRMFTTTLTVNVVVDIIIFNNLI